MKDGMDEEFTRYWSEGTRLIRTEKKSLGSRLHRAADGSFVAYAQWPSRERWKDSNPSSPLLTETLEKMRACLTKMETPFELEVIDDQLARE